MGRNIQLFIFRQIAYVVLLSNCYVRSEESPDPIGHMQPLGSHMAPILVEERDSVPDPKEFFERYMKPRVPVILKNAAKSLPNYETWRDDNYLREKYGKWLIGYEKSKKEDKVEAGYGTLADFLDIYKERDVYLAEYITNDNPMTDDIAVLKCLACGGYIQSIYVLPIFFSSGETKSALHRDDYNNFSCMLDGSKEWIMFDLKHSPDIPSDGSLPGYCGVDPERVDMYRYPTFQNMPWHHAKLERGDCLFVPYGWPHHVISHKGRNMAVNMFLNYMHVIDLKDCPADLNSIPDHTPVGKIWTTESSQMRSSLLTAFINGTKDISMEDFASFLRKNYENESDVDEQEIQEYDMNKDGMISDEEILEFSFDEIFEAQSADLAGVYQKDEL